MRRAQRSFDNPALETATAIANTLAQPLLVFFNLRTRLPHANVRHFSFMIDGLTETAARLAERGIGFVMRRCEHSARDELARLCGEVHPAMVITDENAAAST